MSDYGVFFPAHDCKCKSHCIRACFFYIWAIKPQYLKARNLEIRIPKTHAPVLSNTQRENNALELFLTDK